MLTFLWFGLCAQALGLGMLAWELHEVVQQRRGLIVRLLGDALVPAPEVTR